MTILIITQTISALFIALLLLWRHERTKIIRRQDQDALKQNMHIQEQDKFIEELIKKYGVKGKAKKTFAERLEELKKQKNLSKN